MLQLLDCMGVYHFQQHSVIPLDLLSVSLPNDKLWRLTSAMDWTSFSTSMEGEYLVYLCDCL